MPGATLDHTSLLVLPKFPIYSYEYSPPALLPARSCPTDCIMSLSIRAASELTPVDTKHWLPLAGSPHWFPRPGSPQLLPRTSSPHWFPRTFSPHWLLTGSPHWLPRTGSSSLTSLHRLTALSLRTFCRSTTALRPKECTVFVLVSRIYT